MKFDVTIEATVRKTLRIEADSAQKAIEQAHDQFTTQPEEGVPEKYEEQLIDCKEVAK